MILGASTSIWTYHQKHQSPFGVGKFNIKIKNVLTPPLYEQQMFTPQTEFKILTKGVNFGPRGYYCSHPDAKVSIGIELWV